MESKVKWGVIGSGGIARRRTIPEGIIPARNAQLVAVYDTDPEANAAVAAQFGATACGSVEELLAADIDAVYIASPVSCHLEQVNAAAKAKKHVLCEKTLGLNVIQAELMATACKQQCVTLGTAYMMRFTAQHAAAAEMIRQGKLGKPVYARAQLSCWYPPIEGAWRQDPAQGGGGSLADMGSHCIDLLELCFGEIDRVHCFINNIVHDYPSEDGAVVSLFFKNGALATVDAFFSIPDNSSKNVLELYGSKGSILAKGTIGQGEAGEMTAFLQQDDAGYDAQQAREADQGITIAPPPINPYRAEIEEFSAALLEGREPANSGAIGLNSQRILAACYESAKSGKTVKL